MIPVTDKMCKSNFHAGSNTEVVGLVGISSTSTTWCIDSIHYIVTFGLSLNHTVTRY